MSCLTIKVAGSIGGAGGWGADGERAGLWFFFSVLVGPGEAIARAFFKPPHPLRWRLTFLERWLKRGGGDVIFNQSGAAGRRLNNNMKIDESLPTLATARRKAITAPSLDHTDGARRTHVVFFLLLHHHSPKSTLAYVRPHQPLLLSMSGEGNLICEHVFLSSQGRKANKHSFRPGGWRNENRSRRVPKNLVVSLTTCDAAQLFVLHRRKTPSLLAQRCLRQLQGGWDSGWLKTRG